MPTWRKDERASVRAVREIVREFRAENSKNWCCIQLMFLWLEGKVEKKVMEA